MYRLSGAYSIALVRGQSFQSPQYAHPSIVNIPYDFVHYYKYNRTDLVPKGKR